LSEQKDKPPKQTVLLVGGAMRSGTTVIHRALCTARNSNPYISESWFLHDLFNLFHWNLQRFEVRHQDQFGEPAELARLILLNFNYYIEMVSTRYGNPEVLILKHPELTRHFSTIRQLAPEVKFLVIVRDPRDVIASIKDVNVRHHETDVWSPHGSLKTMQQFCDFYGSYYQGVFTRRADFGSRLMFVRYEDVVTKPQQTFAQISAFSGAVYAGDEMTKFTDEHAQAKNFTKDLRLKDPLSGAYWSDMYTKDLSTDRIGNYAKILNPGEVAEIQRLQSGFGKSFRYW
jgi:hypothetical protein